MSEQMEATFVRDLPVGRTLDDMVQEKKLYRLSEKIEIGSVMGSVSVRHVVVSAITKAFDHGDPETMAFPASQQGVVLSSREMAVVRQFDHHAALHAMGVEVIR